MKLFDFFLRIFPPHPWLQSFFCYYCNVSYLNIVQPCQVYSVNGKTYFHLGSAQPQKPQSSRRRESPARLRRSGSLNLDPDIFKTTNFSDPDVGKMLSLPQKDLVKTSPASWFLTCEFPVSQWHPRAACSLGTPVLSARFLSPPTRPHPDPSCCPPTHWLHSQEAC